MKKILIVSTISLSALFGISQIDFSNKGKPKETIHKTESEMKEILKKQYENEQLTKINNSPLNIEECKNQILPTKVNDKLLDKIYLKQQKSNKNENCKDIYLNILKEEKIANIKELNENPTLQPPYYVQIPEKLNIDYFDENTKTVKYFDYAENFDDFKDIDIKKLSLPDTDTHKVTRMPVYVNNQMFLDVGLFYFADVINNPTLRSNKKKKSYYSKDLEFIQYFPMKNLSFEYPKGKFQNLSLSMFKYEKNSITYIYKNHSGEHKRAGTWQSINFSIYFNKKNKNITSYTKLLLEDGIFILESENDKGIFYHVNRKGK